MLVTSVKFDVPQRSCLGNKTEATTGWNDPGSWEMPQRSCLGNKTEAETLTGLRLELVDASTKLPR